MTTDTNSHEVVTNTETSPTDRFVAYPGTIIRPIPGFMFRVPQGWVIDEAPGALCMVRTPVQIGDYWVNALLSHDRVAKAVNFKVAAQTTWAHIAQTMPDAEIEEERLARFGNNIVYLRGIEVPSPSSDGEPVAQLHAIFYAPEIKDAKTMDMFQFVCSSRASQMDSFATVFIDMIASFQFT